MTRGLTRKILSYSNSILTYTLLPYSMKSETQVLHTTHDDLPFIYNLFDQSIMYQEKKGYPVWRGYDKQVLVNDVNSGNQYKVVIDNQIAIAFSVCYTDKIIWRDMENGSAVYLHRIVVNPAFKGQKLFGQILAWVRGHAEEKGLTTIRMDTWDNNPSLIGYYETFGFRFIERYTTPDSEELPVHNRKLRIVLLEMVLIS